MSWKSVALAGVVTACGGQPSRPQSLAPSTRDSLVGVPHVDRTLIGELTVGGAWERVIDPSVGVVEMRAITRATNETPRAFWVIRRCGKAIATVTSIATRVRDRERAEPTWYSIHCDPIGVRIECRQDALSADDLDVTFRFEYRSAGYMLAGVTVVDPGADATRAIQGFEAEIAKEERCPGYENAPFLDKNPTGASPP